MGSHRPGQKSIWLNPAREIDQILVLIPVTGFPDLDQQLGYGVDRDSEHARAGSEAIAFTKGR